MFAAASPSSLVCLVSGSTAVSVEHKRTHSIVSCVCKRTYSIVSCVCKTTYSIVSVSVAVSVRVLLLWNVFSYYRMFSFTVECVCLHFCVCVCDTTCILSTLPTLSLPSIIEDMGVEPHKRGGRRRRACRHCRLPAPSNATAGRCIYFRTSV